MNSGRRIVSRAWSASGMLGLSPRVTTDVRSLAAAGRLCTLSLAILGGLAACQAPHHHGLPPSAPYYYYPPPPPPPPPPRPNPVMRSFTVYFDYNKANLTAEAQRVVQQAVSAAKMLGTVRVMVTGHTDSVGSAGLNQRLSQRRADAVKMEMVRNGLRADDIVAVGRGFMEESVPTGRGVREPQNRRVIIDLRS
jgi:outer membrane protein OmpA-like peptidoglycan-associated protein